MLNEWNQSWDIPNVFLTDGAAMTSGSCQNPSLTYMVLTARAARALHAIRNCYTSAELSDVHGDLLFVRTFPDSIEIFEAAGIALQRIEPASNSCRRANVRWPTSRVSSGVSRTTRRRTTSRRAMLRPRARWRG